MFCQCCKLFTCQAVWRVCSVSDWWHWCSGWYEPNGVLSENCLNAEAEPFEQFQLCQSVGHSQLLSGLCFHTHIKTHCKPVDMLQMCPTMLLETAVYPCFCPWALQTLTLIHFQTQQAILKHGLHWPQSPDQHWWFCQVSLGVTPSRPEPATQSLRESHSP